MKLALAAIPAGPAAVATLAYRLASYWLALPIGLLAWILHHRRCGDGAVRHHEPEDVRRGPLDRGGRALQNRARRL